MVGIPRMQGLQIALENVNPGSSLRSNTQWSARFWVHAAHHPIAFALFRKKSLFVSAIMPKEKKCTVAQATGWCAVRAQH